MKRLIEKLIDDGYLLTKEIINAFRQINRTDFLFPKSKGKEKLEQDSEINAPIPIQAGQTNSQPLTVAIMLEMLQPMPGNSVLDIGSGSGWTSCLFANLVGEEGRVIAIERIPELKEFGEENAQRYNFANLKFILGDGTKGYSKNAPYDVIHVAAAAKSIPPALIKQLAPEGRLIIPVGEGMQDLVLIKKDKKGKISEKRQPGFVFVPLIED